MDGVSEKLRRQKVTAQGNFTRDPSRVLRHGVSYFLRWAQGTQRTASGWYLRRAVAISVATKQTNPVSAFVDSEFRRDEPGAFLFMSLFSGQRHLLMLHGIES